MTYFQSLDSVRFFAATAVFIHHFEQLKSVYGYSNYWDNSVIRSLGEYGVSIFFVLSGFLITYLLREERLKHGKIHVKAFYMRRLLRIWPLYFAVIALWAFCFFLVPDLWIDHPPKSLGYYFLMLGNVASATGMSIWLLAHLWSIGVEEQFYMAWPWVNKLSRSRLIITLLVFILILWLVRLYAYSLDFHGVVKFFQYSRFDMMAIGGLGAILMDSKWTKLLASSFVQLCLIAMLLLIWTYSIRIPYFLQIPIEGVLYALLIMSLVKSSPETLKHSKLRLLGRRTYGIYMYHPLIIALVLWLAQGWAISSLWLFVVAFVLTIFVSFLSYSYLEKPFLKIKNTRYHVE